MQWVLPRHNQLLQRIVSVFTFLVFQFPPPLLDAVAVGRAHARGMLFSGSLVRGRGQAISLVVMIMNRVRRPTRFGDIVVGCTVERGRELQRYQRAWRVVRGSHTTQMITLLQCNATQHNTQHSAHNTVQHRKAATYLCLAAPQTACAPSRACPAKESPQSSVTAARYPTARCWRRPSGRA